MILILSDDNDFSTTKVIEWLEYSKKEYKRINTQDDLVIDFFGEDIVFNVNKNTFKLSEITAYWYRRGFFIVTKNLFTNIDEFDYLIKDEIKNFIQFIYFKLNKIKHINSITNADVNKLIVSDIAREVGISTPVDLIYSNTSILKNQIKNSSNIFITKVTSGNCIQRFDDFNIFNYTKEIDIDTIKTDTFFPSLVQNYIEKKYELRIFYLDGIFYTMAIFSQKDNQTNIDFRNYNEDKPNRTVPYKLPIHIEEKLDLLMRKLELNCGSIDMIVTPNNEYVFLEVNPVGQFGMVSYPCNYNLEKIIAEYL